MAQALGRFFFDAYRTQVGVKAGGRIDIQLFFADHAQASEAKMHTTYMDLDMMSAQLGVQIIRRSAPTISTVEESESAVPSTEPGSGAESMRGSRQRKLQGKMGGSRLQPSTRSSFFGDFCSHSSHFNAEDSTCYCCPVWP